MAVSPQLLQFKASGVYRLEFDRSQITRINASNVRLILGTSTRGPVNTPVFVETADDFRAIYGDIDSTLEGKGMYFHRSALAALARGPILAMNILPIGEKWMVNYATLNTKADAKNPNDEELTKVSFRKIHNTEKFWFPDSSEFIEAIHPNQDFINFVNIKPDPVTILTKKPESADLRGYNISVKEWYGEEGYPEFLDPDALVSDYMVEVLVARGNFEKTSLATDPVLGKYIDIKNTPILIPETVTSIISPGALLSTYNDDTASVEYFNVEVFNDIVGDETNPVAREFELFSRLGKRKLDYGTDYIALASEVDAGGNRVPASIGADSETYKILEAGQIIEKEFFKDAIRSTSAQIESTDIIILLGSESSLNAQLALATPDEELVSRYVSEIDSEDGGKEQTLTDNLREILTHVLAYNVRGDFKITVNNSSPIYGRDFLVKRGGAVLTEEQFNNGNDLLLGDSIFILDGSNVGRNALQNGGVVAVSYDREIINKVSINPAELNQDIRTGMKYEFKPIAETSEVTTSEGSVLAYGANEDFVLFNVDVVDFNEGNILPNDKELILRDGPNARPILNDGGSFDLVYQTIFTTPAERVPEAPKTYRYDLPIGDENISFNYINSVRSVVEGEERNVTSDLYSKLGNNLIRLIDAPGEDALNNILFKGGEINVEGAKAFIPEMLPEIMAMQDVLSFDAVKFATYVPDSLEVKIGSKVLIGDTDYILDEAASSISVEHSKATHPYFSKQDSITGSFEYQLEKTIEVAVDAQVQEINFNNIITEKLDETSFEVYLDGELIELVDGYSGEYLSGVYTLAHADKPLKNGTYILRYNTGILAQKEGVYSAIKFVLFEDIVEDVIEDSIAITLDGNQVYPDNNEYSIDYSNEQIRLSKSGEALVDGTYVLTYDYRIEDSLEDRRVITDRITFSINPEFYELQGFEVSDERDIKILDQDTPEIQTELSPAGDELTIIAPDDVFEFGLVYNLYYRSRREGQVFDSVDSNITQYDFAIEFPDNNNNYVITKDDAQVYPAGPVVADEPYYDIAEVIDIRGDKFIRLLRKVEDANGDTEFLPLENGTFDLDYTYDNPVSGIEAFNVNITPVFTDTDNDPETPDVITSYNATVTFPTPFSNSEQADQGGIVTLDNGSTVNVTVNGNTTSYSFNRVSQPSNDPADYFIAYTRELDANEELVLSTQDYELNFVGMLDIVIDPAIDTESPMVVTDNEGRIYEGSYNGDNTYTFTSLEPLRNAEYTLDYFYYLRQESLNQVPTKVTELAFQPINIAAIENDPEHPFVITDEQGDVVFDDYAIVGDVITFLKETDGGFELGDVHTFSYKFVESLETPKEVIFDQQEGVVYTFQPTEEYIEGTFGVTRRIEGAADEEIVPSDNYSLVEEGNDGEVRTVTVIPNEGTLEEGETYILSYDRAVPQQNTFLLTGQIDSITFEGLEDVIVEESIMIDPLLEFELIGNDVEARTEDGFPVSEGTYILTYSHNVTEEFEFEREIIAEYPVHMIMNYEDFGVQSVKQLVNISSDNWEAYVKNSSGEVVSFNNLDNTPNEYIIYTNFPTSRGIRIQYPILQESTETVMADAVEGILTGVEVILPDAKTSTLVEINEAEFRLFNGNEEFIFGEDYTLVEIDGFGVENRVSSNIISTDAVGLKVKLLSNDKLLGTTNLNARYILDITQTANVAPNQLAPYIIDSLIISEEPVDTVLTYFQQPSSLPEGAAPLVSGYGDSYYYTSINLQGNPGTPRPINGIRKNDVLIIADKTIVEGDNANERFVIAQYGTEYAERDKVIAKDSLEAYQLNNVTVSHDAIVIDIASIELYRDGVLTTYGIDWAFGTGADILKADIRELAQGDFVYIKNRGNASNPLFELKYDITVSKSIGIENQNDEVKSYVAENVKPSQYVSIGNYSKVPFVDYIDSDKIFEDIYMERRGTFYKNAYGESWAVLPRDANETIADAFEKQPYSSEIGISQHDVPVVIDPLLLAVGGEVKFHYKYKETRPYVYVKRDLLNDFFNEPSVPFIGRYIGSLIPGFVSTEGAPIYIENLVNSETSRTGLFCAVYEEVLYEGDKMSNQVDFSTFTQLSDTGSPRVLLSYAPSDRTLVEFNPTISQKTIDDPIFGLIDRDVVEIDTEYGISSFENELSFRVKTISTEQGLTFQDLDFFQLGAKVGDWFKDVSGLNKILKVEKNLSSEADPITGDETFFAEFKLSLANKVEFSFEFVSNVEQAVFALVFHKDIAETADGFFLEGLNGFNSAGEIINENFATGLDAGVDKILRNSLVGTNLRRGLLDKDAITFRYIVDTYGGGVRGTKTTLSDLAREHASSFAILNAPSLKDFKQSVEPSFKDFEGNVSTKLIADGGDLSKNPSLTYSLPGIPQGANYCGFYAPYFKVIEKGIERLVPPAAYVSNNYIDKFTSATPYSIVAGPRRGVVGGNGLVGLETNFDSVDRSFLEPFGINSIVFQRGTGFVITGNVTAQQTVQSALSSIHVRELMIFIQDGIEQILKNYIYEFNTPQIRLEIKTLADGFMQQLLDDGGVFAFKNVMDETNNTPELIDLKFGILDTYVEPVRGLEILVHRSTILRTGTL